VRDHLGKYFPAEDAKAYRGQEPRLEGRSVDKMLYILDD
jgi:hypothetical protein